MVITVPTRLFKKYSTSLWSKIEVIHCEKYVLAIRNMIDDEISAVFQLKIYGHIQ